MDRNINETLGIITARGGSQGIKKKNITILNGKPLIYYTIEEAKKNLKEAVELYLEDQPKIKKSLPKEAPLVTTLELKHA